MSHLYGDVVIITGASAGIGQATAQELMKDGYKVYGTSRKAKTGDRRIEPGSEGFLEMIPLDVTSDDSVRGAIAYVLEKEKRIDVLINNAGMGIAGAIEDTTLEEAQTQFATNYFGVLRMCRAVLPIMREQKKGLIVTVGSVAGIFSIPFQAQYSASKFAIEALMETLRMETRAFGIRAALVEPGDTKTSFTASRIFTAASKTNPAYQAHCKKAVERMAHDEQHGPEPIVVTRVIQNIIRKKNPPIRIVVGSSYKMLCFFKRLLPAGLVERILASMY